MAECTTYFFVPVHFPFPATGSGGRTLRALVLHVRKYPNFVEFLNTEVPPPPCNKPFSSASTPLTPLPPVTLLLQGLDQTLPGVSSLESGATAHMSADQRT